VAVTILTPADLDDVRNNLDGDYVLGADIDLIGYANWVPIGDEADPFTGKIDGSIYEISNLTIDRSTTDNVGLFGACQSNVLANAPNLKNITITGAYVTGQDNVGVLAGKITTDKYTTDGFNLIENCSSTGVIVGRTNVGGLVGCAEGVEAGVDYGDEDYYHIGRIASSYSLVAVTGSGENIGGLVGYLKYLKAYQFHATGTVTGGDVVGGLVGYYYDCSCEFCYATGNVTGEKCVGGLVGYAGDRSLIRKSYAEGDVTGTEAISEPEIWNTSHIGVGGLVGFMDFELIDRCYALGDVVGSYRAGGLVGAGNGGGYRSPNIANSFAQGNVSAIGHVGGVIGYVFPYYLDFRNVYCTGSVTGNRRGAIIGYRGAPYFPDDPIGTITYETPAYYNSDTNTATNTHGGEGKTTNELGIETTYQEDWFSFDYYFVIDQDESVYPILKIFYDPLGIVISAVKGSVAQGLVCAYTVDGVTYYRKFDGASWAAAFEVTEVPPGTDTLNTFKTNDDRIGFAADVDGVMTLSLTEQDSMTIEYIKTLPSGTCGNLIQTIEDVPKLYYVNAVQSMSKSEAVFSDDWGSLAFSSAMNMASDSYISRLKAKYFDSKTWLAWRSRGQHRIFPQIEAAEEEEALKLASGSITLRQDTPVVSVSLEVDSFDRTEEVIPETPEEVTVIGYQGVTPLTEVPEGYTGIYSVTDMLAVTGNMAGNYIQLVNLDMSAYPNWVPLVGDPNGLLEGIFDGNGYKITGFTGAGLFVGTHPTGIIKNVRLIDVNINKPYDDVSVIITQYHSGKIQNCYVSGNIIGDDCNGISAGTYYGDSEISNCTVEATIVAYGRASGIASNYESKIINCTVSGNISAIDSVGGICQYNNGKVENCIVLANVSAIGNVGGLIQGSFSDIPIKNCSVFGNVSSVEGDAGGLIQYAGYDENQSLAGLEDCHTRGNVNSSGENNVNVGGLVSFLEISTLRCYATGDVTAVNEDYNSVGGFAGFIGGGDVDECYSLGNVTGQGAVGGFVGELWKSPEGKITDCYAKGNVSNDSIAGQTGGFIGIGDYEIENCYSVGKVNGQNTDTGGFVGWSVFLLPYPDGGGGIVTSCYYDSETSGQSDTHGGISKTTAEMKTQSTFVNWDFTIWKLSSITEGYPALKWQMGNDENVPNYPPASKIKLNFKAGDSDPLLMGSFYVDRTSFTVGRANVGVDARNSIGKYLKDQTFDERNIYVKQQIQLLLAQILASAGITNYYVGPETAELGMEFSPNQDILSGINDVLTTIRDWQVREEPDGKVVIAERTDTAFTQPGTYTFYRNRDVFSRSVTKDDSNTYGRVCVHTSDFSVKAYRPVSSNLGWLPPAQKTLYQQCPDGTTSIQAAALATEIAERLSNSGEVEEFVGPIRPQLMPGDGAQIIDEDGPNLLGTITTVTHRFGKDGFYTQFTVDSGGKINKPLLSDYLKQISAGTVKSKITS